MAQKYPDGTIADGPNGPMVYNSGRGWSPVNRPGVPANGIRVRQVEGDIRNTSAQAGRTAVQTRGDEIDNNIKGATANASIDKAIADAKRAQVDAQARAAEVAFQQAHNGMGRDQYNEARGGLDQINALNQQVADLRNQYNQNFKGKNAGSLLEYLPSVFRPANGVFSSTANSMLADMAKAKGLTSQQFNTPAEQKMFFQPLIPQPSDTDEVIAKKIDALQKMINLSTNKFARQLGSRVAVNPPAPSNNSEKNANSVVNFNDLP
jgi:hypothetical protein